MAFFKEFLVIILVTCMTIHEMDAACTSDADVQNCYRTGLDYIEAILSTPQFCNAKTASCESANTSFNKCGADYSDCSQPSGTLTTLKSNAKLAYRFVCEDQEDCGVAAAQILSWPLYLAVLIFTFKRLYSYLD